MIYNKGGEIINTAASWNSQKGEKVQEIISGALDATVTDVIIESDPGNIDISQGVPYWILKGGEAKGQKQPSGYISLITPSQYQVNLELGTAYAGVITDYTIPSFMSDTFSTLTIPYVYWFTEQGSTEKIGNATSTIHVYINGSEKYTKNLVSNKNGYVVGNIELSRELFQNGQNTIRIIGSSEYGGGQAQTIALDTTYINIIDLQLTCDITVNDHSYETPVDPTDTLLFEFGLNVADDKTLPSYLSGRVQLRIYYNGTLTNNDLNNLNDFSTTLASLAQSISGTYSPGSQNIYIQLVATNEQDQQLKSNLIWYRFLGKSGTNEESLSGLYLGFKLDIDSTPSPNFVKTILQFSKTEFDFTIFNLDSNINTYAYGFGEKTQQYEISGKLQNQYCSKETLKFYKVFDTNETQSLIISSNDTSLLTLIINVVESSSTFVFPTVNLLLKLDGSGKIDGKKDDEWSYENINCDFQDFNWVGNGWNDSKLYLNQGSTVTIPCEVFSYSTYSIVFNIETQGINGEKLISCLNSNEDLGFIVYSDKIECKLYRGGSFSYTFGEGSHEIALVKYGSNYKNTFIVYIDGSIQCIRQPESYDIHYNPIILTANKDKLIVSDIVIYSRALSFNEIQSIYGYHKDFGMEEYFNSNNIFGTNNISGIKYQGDKVTPDTLPIGSSYMIIEADPCDDKPWETINRYPGNTQAIADQYKGIRHKIKSIKYVRKSAEGNDSTNFFILGGTLSAQGTSSMNYYLKNFRIYTKKTIDSSLPGYNDGNNILYSDGGEAGDNGFSTHGFIGVTENFYYDGVNQTGEYPEGGHMFSNNPNKPASIKIQLFKQGEGFGTEHYSYGSVPTDVFCLKADYAESSGTHNTGFARFVDFYLKNSDDVRKSGETIPDDDVTQAFTKDGAVKDIPQEVHRGEYSYDIRTTIDGKPVYLFFKDVAGNVYYHGKYNLNNEKSTSDVYGFTGINDYYNMSDVKNEAGNLALLFNTIQGGEDYFKHTHQTYKIENGKYKENKKGEGTFVNPNECWEFSNNEFTTNEGLTKDQNNIGAFQYPYPVNSSYPLYSQYSNLNPFRALGNIVNSDGVTETKLAWITQAWEYRFPEGEKNKYDGSHTTDSLYQNGQIPYLLDSLYKWIYKHNITLIANAQKEAASNEFAYQLSWYFNVNYLVKYYVLTKFFACVDQRIKNAMLSILCEPYADNNDGTIDSVSPMGHMRAFFIFYDNDTILGLSNDGTLKWPWNVDEGTNNVDYQGNVSAAYAGTGVCGLWSALEYCLNTYINVESKPLFKSDNNKYAYELGKYIAKAYGQLSNMLPNLLNNNSAFENYFESICNHFNDSAYNLDTQIKYIFPEKLRGGQSGTISDNLEKETGNRKAHRTAWINSRKAWYDNMLGQGDYSQYLYAFKVAGVGSATRSGEISVTQALPKFKFNAATSQTIVSSSLSTNGNMTSTVVLPSISVSDSISVTGLYAAEVLDFSKFMFTSGSYLSQTDAMTGSEQSLKYLKKLIFTPHESRTGDDAFQYIGTGTLSALIDSNRLPNLEELSFANIKPEGNNVAYGTLNLSGFNFLTSIDTSNTVINMVKLPKGSSLQTLKLDSPIYLGRVSSLNQDENDEGIVNKSNLTSINIGFSRLEELVLGDNNNQAVYDYIFNNLYTTLQSSNNLNYIVIRLSNDPLNPTIISNSNHAIDNLIEIAKFAINNNITNKFNVSGYLYNETISENEDARYLKIAFGNNFNITSDLGRITLKIEGNKTLVQEGDEPIVLQSNGHFPKNDWSITINGIEYTSNTKHDLQKYLSIEFDDNENPTNVTITAREAKNVENGVRNIGFNRIPIVVTVKDDEYDSMDNSDEDKVNHIAQKTFYVTYTPLTSVRIQSVNERDIYVNTNDVIYLWTNQNELGIKDSDIIIKTNTGCTKSLEDTDIYLSIKSSDTWSEYNKTNQISRSNESPLNTGDIEIKVRILDIDSNNTLMLYKDEFLLELSTINSDLQYHWIKELRDTYDPNSTVNSITKGYLNRFNVNSSIVNSFNTTNADSQQILPNLEHLKYCNWTSGTFNIPSYLFTSKICIPDKVTSVSWTMNSFSNEMDYTGLQIVFPKNMENCQLNLSGLQNQIENLTLDFRKCEKITTLCGLTRPANISNNYISIKFTYNNPNESNNTYTLQTNDNGLLLPSTINLIGYYDLTSNSYPDSDRTMFNISGKSISDTNTTRDPAAFIIPAVPGSVTLGAIYGYRTTLADIQTLPIQQLRSDYSKNIINMSHTCAYSTCTMLNMDLDLSSVQNLGPYSFYNNDNSLKLGTVTFNALETIGNNAFGEANIIIKGNSEDSTSVPKKTFQVFPSLNYIGTNAFLKYSPKDANNNIIETCIEIINRVFISESNSLASLNGVPLNLYLNYSKETENDQNPDYTIDSLTFGNKAGNEKDSYLYVGNSYCYDELSNQEVFNTISNRLLGIIKTYQE